jgi:adenylate cyclase
MSAGSGMTTPGGAPFSMAGAHPVTSSGSSSNSVDSRTGFPHADGSISSHSSHPGSGSNHRGGSGSDAGSDPRASLAPPFNLPSQSSPKGFKGNILLPLNQPRRPSQLRNVNSSAEEYDENPFDQIQPVSANSLFSSSTAFSDPFSSSRMTNPSSATLGANWEVDPTSPGTSARSQDGNSPNDSLSPRTLLPAFISTGGATGPSTAPPIPPAGAAQGAWIAPESWGVEGDQEDEASLSSEEDDEELGAINMLGASLASRKKSMRQGSGGDVVSRAREDSEGSLVGSRNASLTHGIGGSMRPMTSGSTRSAGTFGGRPGTGTRPSTGGRMGTSTSGTLGLQVSSLAHLLRSSAFFQIECLHS